MPLSERSEDRQNPLPGSGSARNAVSVRRRTDYDSGRALELLGHAIEYLADELVHDVGTIPEYQGRVEAIQLLMKVNRKVYLACPVAPRFEFIPWLGERIFHAFRIHSESTPT
jgi:hypothetical protein